MKALTPNNELLQRSMHTLELHIWGPAFGLPSLHAECIAAVAFLKRVLQPEDWVVIPSYDTSSSPSKDFPLLRHGDRWISGFYTIVEHLRELRIRTIDVDLSREQRADRSAFSTFISTSAQPLIDLSLCASLINYRSATQPAYTALLPWHLNYTIPPQHRAAAQARTQHLGVSVLGVDTVHGDTDGTGGSQTAGQVHPQPNSVVSAQGRGGQSRPGPFSKQTILAMVQAPQHAGRFRLESLVTAFLDPLQDYLRDKTYLLGGDEPTSLDCLAVGYLGLMFYPDVPMDSLRHIMKSKFVKVCRYVERMRGELFGEEKFVVKDIVALSLLETPTGIQKERKKLEMSVPWQPPAPEAPGLAGVLATLGGQLASRIPGLHRVTIQHMTDEGREDDTARLTPFRKPSDYLQILGLMGGALAFVGYFAYQHFSGSNPKLQSFYSSRPVKLSDLGEAGAALAVLSQHLDHDAAVDRSWVGMQGREEPVVEVDVEVGGDPLV